MRVGVDSARHELDPSPTGRSYGFGHRLEPGDHPSAIGRGVLPVEHNLRHAQSVGSGPQRYAAVRIQFLLGKGLQISRGAGLRACVGHQGCDVADSDSPRLKRHSVGEGTDQELQFKTSGRR